MTVSEKINAIHALQNVLNPKVVGSERVLILNEAQEKIVKDKLIEIVTNLNIDQRLS